MKPGISIILFLGLFVLTGVYSCAKKDISEPDPRVEEVQLAETVKETNPVTKKDSGGTTILAHIT
ncbi:MAG: hypothetical protein O6849_04170, partial [Candidatus Dadabacteria bacterium]|nr:hypothetical protein [Candidatus Dadabacteria bacterium]